jgi:DNA-directed RNA polymerase specialized sigma24 family protein
MFLVTRNSQRSEIRRSKLCERLRAVSQHPSVRNYFDQDGDHRAAYLVTALHGLNQLDRELLVGSAWSGHSHAELASQHHMTAKAVEHRIARARESVRNRIQESLLSNG